MRSVLDFGVLGDGTADDTEALQHAVAQDLKALYFPPGTYRITRPIEVELGAQGPLSLSGAGGAAKIVMEGAGPAFHIKGSHEGTAGPNTFKDIVWQRERMPTLLNLEIEGAHPEADGLRVEGAMQLLIEGVLLRELRHGVHLVKRNRNVLISHCHIYHNRGVGIFCDHVNLHQFNVVGSHISYNAQSGIKLLNGEIRNFQFTGNDIEYNYGNPEAEGYVPSAEIWIEATDGKGTIREGTIASSTIQSRYAPGGANIHLQGPGIDPDQVGMIAITGNLLGSQAVNLRMEACRAVTVSGNVVYSGHEYNILARHSRHLVVSGNSIDHNHGYIPRELSNCVRFEACADSSFSATTIQDALAGEHTVNTPAVMARKGLLEVIDCTRFQVQGCQVLDSGAGAGIFLQGGRQNHLSGCTITDGRDEKKMGVAIRWEGAGEQNWVHGNLLSAGSDGHTALGTDSGIKLGENFLA